MIGQIRIGTIGRVGAIDGMWSGLDDRNRTEELHDPWIEEFQRKHFLPRGGAMRAFPLGA